MNGKMEYVYGLGGCRVGFRAQAFQFIHGTTEKRVFPK